MKFIAPSKTSTITMSNEDSDFPAENVLTSYVKQKAKSTTSETTFNAQVYAGAGGAIGIFGTNALTVTAYYSGGIDVAWDTGISWDSGISWEEDAFFDLVGTYSPVLYNYLQGSEGRLWIDLPTDWITGSFGLKMLFTCPDSEVVEVGIIYIGPRHEYRNPLLGVGTGVVDYSQERELNSPGAIYVDDKDQVRTWAVNFAAEYEPAIGTAKLPTVGFYQFIYDIVSDVQLNPFPCWFIDDDYRHFAFCRFQKNRMPRGRMGGMINYGEYSIELIEVV